MTEEEFECYLVEEEEEKTKTLAEHIYIYIITEYNKNSNY